MFRFICGTIFGIFLEQNYDLPNLMNVAQDIRIMISKYEKVEDQKPGDNEDENKKT